LGHPAEQKIDYEFAAPAPLVVNADGCSPVVLVCEHASRFVPAELHGLGLDDGTLEGHWAWDPGALAVAEAMSRQMDAVLVAAQISRMVYDCNRPPTAPDAIVETGEGFAIPGNAGLGSAERDFRVAHVYEPFHETLADVINASESAPVIVTVHSFTRYYHGQERRMELGILHDDDARLADQLLQEAMWHSHHDVQRNEPYGPQDGVTHTLKKHALPIGAYNVMLEIRSDLITSQETQHAMGVILADMINSTLRQFDVLLPEGES
jgi:predicted N-formylglutamate amidohydrolase